MRGGGGGRSSSSVSRQRRMPQRKQQTEDDSQDGDTLETNDEMSSTLPETVTSRDRRRRERENRTRTTDMTEEQMMDLALQLSEQEANISALRLQKEEEAVVKAIQESMFSQTQACPSSVQNCSGHNGTSQEPDVPGAVGGRERDRKPETLGLSHTQRIDCELNEDSQQSSDSLQDASLLSRSPVFPSTGRRAEVLVPRLTQDVLDTCRSSGFVHCSQDGWRSPQSPGEDASSTTFRSSPVFSETGRGDAGTSPALGLNTRRPGFCRTQDGISGFTAVSQETVPSSTRSTSCRTQSPVFPRSPRLDEAESIRSPEVDREHTAGPAEDRTRGPQWTRPEQQGRMDVQTGLGPDVDSSEDPDQDQELSSHMTLRWSSEDEDATLVATPSPVFSEERPLPQADHVTHSHVTSACPEPTRLDQSRRRQSPGRSGSRRPASSGSVSRTPSTVHYYWGVPFCPRGLDPDHYTQVIVAQMEVYEKTLKQAQRGLLRKAEWGEAVLPQPKKSPSSESRTGSPQQLLPPRRGLRLRGTRQSEDADVCPAEEEEGEKEEEPEEQVDTDCEVCPETQLIDSDDDRTQDLTERTETPERMETSEKMEEDNMDTELEQPEDTGSVRDKLQDEDVDVDTTSRGHDGSPVKEDDQECPDVEDITERELQRSTSPELELTAVPQVPEGTVDCPICQGSFPVARIVMHAAFCDGELAAVDETRTADDRSHVSLKLRRKRTRRGDMEDTAETSTTRNQETCFICCRSVPQRLYSRHTELCLRQQRASERPKQNLLLALDRSDHTDSDVGPSGSNLQTREVIDLRDDDDEEDEGGVTAAGTSNPRPIRTFTPISEATDCLVDFSKQQRLKKVGQRRR